MTTPAPIRPTDRIAAGLTASAEQPGSPVVPLTAPQEAMRLALRKASDRGDRLSPSQRMQLGLLTTQADAAQAVAQ